MSIALAGVVVYTTTYITNVFDDRVEKRAVKELNEIENNNAEEFYTSLLNIKGQV